MWFLTVQFTTRLRKFTRHGPFRTLRAATPAAHDLPTCLPQSVSDLTNSPTEISDHPSPLRELRYSTDIWQRLARPKQTNAHVARPPKPSSTSCSHARCGHHIAWSSTDRQKGTRATSLCLSEGKQEETRKIGCPTKGQSGLQSNTPRRQAAYNRPEPPPLSSLLVFRTSQHSHHNLPTSNTGKHALAAGLRTPDTWRTSSRWMHV